MIRKTVESYTKAIEGILDANGNPVKWFVVVRSTIWVFWVIPVISWEVDSEGVDRSVSRDALKDALLMSFAGISIVFLIMIFCLR